MYLLKIAFLVLLVRVSYTFQNDGECCCMQTVVNSINKTKIIDIISGSNNQIVDTIEKSQYSSTNNNHQCIAGKCQQNDMKIVRVSVDTKTTGKRTKRSLFDSLINSENGFTTRMRNSELGQYFQIDCNANEQPQPSLKRRINYVKLLHKRLGRYLQTTSTTRLPSGSGVLTNRSNHAQKLVTPSQRMSVTKEREVTISKMIGATHNKEYSTSNTNESSNQFESQFNREDSVQNISTNSFDSSQHSSNNRTSERSKESQTTKNWEVGGSAGFSAFGFTIGGSGSRSGSDSDTTSNSDSNSNTNDKSTSRSETDSRTGLSSFGTTSSNSNTRTKGFTSSVSNAVISEQSTNDAMTVKESVTEDLTFQSQEINVLQNTEVEFTYNIIQYDTIDLYYLDFEIDANADTEAFEFERKEATCVISSNGRTFPMRHFLAIKQSFDLCCSMYFDTIETDAIVKRNGKWIVKNIPAIEKLTNYRTTMNVFEKQIN